MEIANLCRSSLSFFSEQQLCYADILSQSEARARIEVAVLNFLKILNCQDPAVSRLPLVTLVFVSLLLFDRFVLQLLDCNTILAGFSSIKEGKDLVVQ